MAKVALQLARLSVNEKIQLARRIVTDMTNNPNFPTPEPALATMTAALDAVTQAQIVAADGGKEQTLLLTTKVKVLETLLTQASVYVEFVSAGDEAKIMSAGMPVRAKSAPVGPMPKLTDFKVVNTDNNGEFLCTVQPVKGANSYIFQISNTPENAGTWVTGAIATRAKALISGLTSGTKYYVRTAAIGSAGQGPWTDIIQRYAQ